MKIEVTLKQAFINTILRCDNNPYTREELESINLYGCQVLHDELMLSRGKPIKKLTEAELESWRERQFD